MKYFDRDWLEYLMTGRLKKRRDLEQNIPTPDIRDVKLIDGAGLIRTEEWKCHHQCTSNCRRNGCWCRCGPWHEEFDESKERLEMDLQQEKELNNKY